MARATGWIAGLLFAAAVLAAVLFFSGPLLVPFSGPAAENSADRVSGGEQIYFFGTDSEGNRIPRLGGPSWIHELGGSCVNCHGPDGRGGFPATAKIMVDADIRYGVLTSTVPGSGKNVSRDRHTYTDEDLGLAVTEGIRPGGDRLDPLMPIWKMGKEDTQSLIAFLKTLR